MEVRRDEHKAAGAESPAEGAGPVGGSCPVRKFAKVF